MVLIFLKEARGGGNGLHEYIIFIPMETPLAALVFPGRMIKSNIITYLSIVAFFKKNCYYETG